MKNDIIKIENLTFEYLGEDDNKVKALDNISLEIEAGTFTAIIGENGSGKSTLAKNLNGLLLPSSGSIFVDGYDTKDDEHIWNIRQVAGMVFQNPDNQLVSSIVEDDVAFGPENLGVDPKEIRERVDKALESVNMGKYKNKGPHQLSGGQKQRIAIAGILAMEPKCIIFDEPTAMLDPVGRKEIMDIIEELSSKGITIILITHYMEEAVLADRVIVMDHGTVAMDGTPDEIFKDIDKIRELKLDVPASVQLSYELRNLGLDIPSMVNEEDLVEYLCQLK